MLSSVVVVSGFITTITTITFSIVPWYMCAGMAVSGFIIIILTTVPNHLGALWSAVMVNISHISTSTNALS